MNYKFADNTPIYVQLIEMIKIKIVSGKYESGSKLPTVRDIALEYGVNPNTVQRAFMELERDGLVKADRTSGRFVTDDKKIIDLELKQLSETYVDDLFVKLNSLGMNDEQIVKLIKERSKKK